MKTEQLKQVLKHMIKEEVDRAVSEQVNRAMARILVEVLNTKAATQPSNNETEPPVIREVKKRTYVKDEALNEALNATVPDLRNRESSAAPMVSLSEMFDKVGTEEDVIASQPTEVKLDTSSKLNMLKSIVGNTAVVQQKSVLDNPDNPLRSVFKKDFRSLMKRIDEKKENGSTRGVFSGIVPMVPQLGGYEQS